MSLKKFVDPRGCRSRGDQHGLFHAPSGGLQGLAGFVFGHLGDLADNAAGTSDQLGIVGDNVDHHALIDVAKPHPDQGRHQVQRHLLRGTRVPAPSRVEPATTSGWVARQIGTSAVCKSGVLGLLAIAMTLALAARAASATESA